MAESMKKLVKDFNIHLSEHARVHSHTHTHTYISQAYCNYRNENNEVHQRNTKEGVMDNIRGYSRKTQPGKYNLA